MRQVVLDTETTGLEPEQGHRIIEIGCVELVSRRRTGNHYHQYLQPDRDVEDGAIDVHGITNEFLIDKPRFADVVEEFLTFIDGAQLIIHNAPFDVGFINHELGLLGPSQGQVSTRCKVLDTLALARKLHPGQRNSLDALCKRYAVDNSRREWHGALLDAEILADVYLAMTGGQASLSLESHKQDVDSGNAAFTPVAVDRSPLRVLPASAQERQAHEDYLDLIESTADKTSIWRQGNY